MKIRKRPSAGGLFIRNWQGEAPAGRYSGVLEEQKGQIRAAVIHKAERVYDASQKAIVRQWSF